jgi:hypothetical protein
MYKNVVKLKVWKNVDIRQRKFKVVLRAVKAYMALNQSKWLLVDLLLVVEMVLLNVVELKLNIANHGY